MWLIIHTHILYIAIVNDQHVTDGYIIVHLFYRCNKVYQVHIYQVRFTPDGVEYQDERGYERFGYITSEDGDTLTHAKQASEGSFIILDNQSFVYARHVHAKPPYSANFNSITIAFDSENLKLLMKSKVFEKTSYDFTVEVRFELKHSYFYRLHRAVNLLSKDVTCKLNPRVEMLSQALNEDRRFYYRSPEPVYDNLQLDEAQMKSLHVILNSLPDFPILLAGPFGTGKTRLLARAAYDILKKRNSRVLICAHHQASVDTFVKYFGDLIYDDENPWDMGMIRIIPNQSYRSEVKNNYEEFFKVSKQVTSKDLEHNRLVITTLGTALNLHRLIQKKEFFSDILIDEGAQSREPETVGPLCVAGKYTRIIIAGDHCQVRAIEG